MIVNCRNGINAMSMMMVMMRSMRGGMRIHEFVSVQSTTAAGRGCRGGSGIVRAQEHAAKGHEGASGFPDRHGLLPAKDFEDEQDEGLGIAPTHGIANGRILQGQDKADNLTSIKKGNEGQAGEEEPPWRSAGIGLCRSRGAWCRGYLCGRGMPPERKGTQYQTGGRGTPKDLEDRCRNGMLQFQQGSNGRQGNRGQ